MVNIVSNEENYWVHTIYLWSTT